LPFYNIKVEAHGSGIVLDAADSSLPALSARRRMQNNNNGDKIQINSMKRMQEVIANKLQLLSVK